MGYVYIALNLECWKCARTRFSLRKLSGGTAQLRTLEGTLPPGYAYNLMFMF